MLYKCVTNTQLKLFFCSFYAHVFFTRVSGLGKEKKKCSRFLYPCELSWKRKKKTEKKTAADLCQHWEEE